MERRFFAGLVAAALLMLAPASAPAQESGKGSGNGLIVPVSGMVNGSPATGTFKVNRFGTVGNDVRAFGTLTLSYGTQVAVIATSMKLVPPGTATASTNLGPSAVTTAPAAAACEILSLTLGPLHLDLLGLVIDLNQVQLNITAEPGAGNLLGNLLCAVANLLNGINLSGLLQQLVNALNALIAAL